MATVTEPKKPALSVSAYDQVSGMLIAVLAALAAVVCLLAIVWWSSRVYLPAPALPVAVDVGGGGGDGGLGNEIPRPVVQEFEEPATSEIPPAVEARVVETVDAEVISLAVAQQELLPELIESNANTAGRSGPIGKRRGPGLGDGPTEGVPPWERWEVRLNAPTLDEYARQLDQFKIELAVAGGGTAVVTYVSNVSASQPSVRTGNPKDEKRLRFMHRSGALRDADRQLVQKAGVDPTNQIVFQFYSIDTYTKLLLLENIEKGQRPIIDIRRTIFGVRETSGKYEFFVVGQEYR